MAFYEGHKTTSILPPKQLLITSQVSSVNGVLEVIEVETQKLDLIFIMLAIAMTMIISGALGEITFNPINRSSLSILTGLLIGMFFGELVGITVGVLVGILTTNKLTKALVGITVGALVGITVGVLVGESAGGYGLTNEATLEWIVFCILMIVLEYAIVFYRYRKQIKSESLI